MRFRTTKYSREFQKPLFLIWPIYGAPSSSWKAGKKPSKTAESKKLARQGGSPAQTLFWNAGKTSNN